MNEPKCTCRYIPKQITSDVIAPTSHWEVGVDVVGKKFEEYLVLDSTYGCEIHCTHDGLKGPEIRCACGYIGPN